MAESTRESAASSSRLAKGVLPASLTMSSLEAGQDALAAKAASASLAASRAASVVAGGGDMLLASLGIPQGGTSGTSPIPAVAGGHSGGSDIRSLIQQKEKELHDINEYRIRSLEDTVRRHEKSESDLRLKFSKLKEDFSYNLKLIEDRDIELDKYERMFEQLKLVVRDREQKLQEMQKRLEDAEGRLKQQRRSTTEQEERLQDKLKEVHAQLESERWERDDAERKHAETLSSASRDLDRRLREKDEQASAARRDLAKSYDSILAQQEEDRKKVAGKHAERERELESQLKALQHELDAQRERAVTLSSDLDRFRQSAEGSSKKLSDVEYELEKLQKDRDKEVEDLQREKEEMAHLKQSLLDEYEGKMGELLQNLQVVERAFVTQREQYEAQLQQQASGREEELQRTTRRLEGRLESLVERLQASEEIVKQQREDLDRAREDHETLLATEKEAHDKTRADAVAAAAKLEARERELKQELWNRDLELKSAKETLSGLRDVRERAEASGRALRDQVEELAARESELKRDLLETNERWERRWEEEMRKQGHKHNQLTEVLQKQRDHLAKEKRKLEERILDLEADLNRTRAEVNAARARARPIAMSTNAAEERVPASVHSMPLSAPAPAPAPATAEVAPRESTSQQLGDDDLQAMPKKERNEADVANLKRETVSPMTSAELFSDDLGPPSPLGSISGISPATRHRRPDAALSERADGPGERSYAPSTAVMEVELENARLRDAVARMRHEMEELALARVKEREALEKEEGVSAEARSAQDGHKEGGHRNNNDAAFLRSKLNQADVDLDRLLKEREKLMDISNQLRADLEHVVSTAATTSPTDIAEAVRRTEEETSHKYEQKIQSIESRLRDLAAHNKALTAELSSQWGGSRESREGAVFDSTDISSADADMEAAISALQQSREVLRREPAPARDGLVRSRASRRRPRQIEQRSRRLPVRDDDNEEEMGEEEQAQEEGRKMAAKHARVKARTGLQHPASNDGGRGGALEAAISGTSHRVKAARAKLQRVRDSLDLEATRPPFSSRESLPKPVNVSDRATESQKRIGARMRESQRRRKMTQERKAVRNYNRVDA